MDSANFASRGVLGSSPPALCIVPVLYSRWSYVESAKVRSSGIHKTLIIPTRIMAPHRLGLSGAGRWGRPNFALTQF